MLQWEPAAAVAEAEAGAASSRRRGGSGSGSGSSSSGFNRSGHSLAIRSMKPMLMRPEVASRVGQTGAIATSYDEAVRLLASAARMIRQTVEGVEQAKCPASLKGARDSFAKLLRSSPAEADEMGGHDFADALAQAVVFGCLLARIEAGADVNPTSAFEALDSQRHPFLKKILHGLRAPELGADTQVPHALCAACDMINRAAPKLAGPDGDWTRVSYAYEDFFAIYRPEDRFKFGVFYTPMEIARYQVREVSRVLREHFGFDGIIDRSVRFLDPACGTGTYLLALAEVASEEAASQQLPIGATLHELFSNRVVGFEVSPGPACVAQARLATWLRSPPRNVVLNGRFPIFTVNALTPAAATALGHEGNSRFDDIVDEPAEGNRVKSAVAAFVVIGNPPWGRRGREYFDFGAVDESGDQQNLLAEWARGADGAVQSVYDLYIAFWRFACRILLERPETQPARGIVSYVTNRSWLRGPPFTTIRGYLRDRGAIAYVTDLGGDIRAGDFVNDEGVFAVKAGSSIATLVFGGTGSPSVTHFRRLLGKREDKLRKLQDSPHWRPVPCHRTDPFAPTDWGVLQDAPSVRDFFAASMPGVKTHRDDLVVGMNEAEVLTVLNTWNELPSIERVQRFHVSRGRDVPARHCVSRANIRLYRYRPLDNRMLYADKAFIQEPGRITKTYDIQPNARCLQFLQSSTVSGPVIIGASALPDYHSVRGSYGSHAVMIDVVRTGRQSRLPTHPRSEDLQLLSEWAARWAKAMQVSTEQVGCYLLALANAPAYVKRFGDAVKSEPPRIPATIDRELLVDAIAVGRRLLHAWSLLSEPAGSWRHSPAPGARLGPARIDESSVAFDSGDQLVGLHSEIGAFEVSGYPVFRRYLEARSHCVLSSDLAADIRRVAGAIAVILNERAECDALLERALQSSTFLDTRL
jgi:predicted helicase